MPNRYMEEPAFLKLPCKYLLNICLSMPVQQLYSIRLPDSIVFCKKQKNILEIICIDSMFGTITGFKAVGAKKLQVEFGSAVAEAAKASLTIKRGNSPVVGKATWNAESKVATFVSDTILPAGDYTASMGANDTPATLKVEAEKVDKIEIKDQPVLTGTSDASKNNGRSNDEAYIYYDVLNQYGESIRERATVNWSITSCDASRDNKNLGLVVAHRKNDKEIFTYGTEIHVTAVCIKDGTTVTDNKTLKIGEMQAIDKVEYKGFSKRSYHDRTLDRKNVKDIQDTVPADFATKTWTLLYQAYDQNGNMLEPAKDNVSSAKEGAKLTFISDQPTLVMNDFEDGEIYKVNEGEVTAEYSSVNIEPGMYIDRETEVGLKAISTRTGQKNEQKFTIDGTQRLQSFKIETPSHIVADGDVTDLPFTAIDTAGNPVTDYKTIARSSNTLSFSASEGTIELTQGNKGEAVLKWYDADKYRFVLDANGRKAEPEQRINPYMDGVNNGIIINDNVDRTISLTAVVTGKESASNTTTLAVSDMRRPHSIENVNFGTDGNDMVIAGFEKQEVGIVSDMAYIDQYGQPLPNNVDVYGTDNRASLFWDAAKLGRIRGYDYSIRAKQLSGNYTIFGSMSNSNKTDKDNNGSNDILKDQITDNIWGASDNSSGSLNADSDVINIRELWDNQKVLDIHHNARYARTASAAIDSNKNIDKVSNATVSYSIVEREKTNNSRYNDIGKTRTETYTVVPLSEVSDFTIQTVKDKLGIITNMSKYPNGSYLKNMGNDDNASKTMSKPAEGYKYKDGKLVDKYDSVVTDESSAATTTAIEIATTGNTSRNWWEDIPANKIQVKAKYQGNTLTVPFMYIRSTIAGPWSKPYDGKIKDDDGNEVTVKNYRGLVSGSALALSSDNDKLDKSYYGSSKYNYNLNTAGEFSDYSDKNDDSTTPKLIDKYASLIYKTNEDFIKWEDLYDVSTARYTRKDANLALQLYIDEEPRNYYTKEIKDAQGVVIGREPNSKEVDTTGNKTYDTKDGERNYVYNDGSVVEKRITISDAPAQPANIEFLDKTILWRPYMATIENDVIIKGIKGQPWEKQIRVYDQYGQLNDGGRDVFYTVSDYTENPDGRIEKNYKIDKNGQNGSAVKGVELGDSYTLTANLENSGLTARATITAGGDNAAKIVSNKVMSESDEYKLRSEYLGYNR